MFKSAQLIPVKRIFSSVLTLSVCLGSVSMPVFVQPSWGQSQDEKSQELEKLIQQAAQQTQQRQLIQAKQAWQQALAMAQELKNRKLEALALLGMGKIYDSMGQLRQAWGYYNQALLIFREVNDRSGEAVTLNNIGTVYKAIGQPQEAFNYYNQALPILREVRDRSGEAATLNNMGAVYDAIGQPQEAFNYYNQALPILREVKDRFGEANTLNNMGAVYNAIGQPQEAFNYYNQALPILREVKDRFGEANTLNNMGAVYDAIGQPQEAFNYYNQALPILREVKDRFGEATTLNNMGLIYDSIGQPQEAFNYYNQALPILREINYRAGEAKTLNNIGAVYDAIGQPKQALNYYNQALPIHREVKDRSGEATTLNNIGGVYNATGQPKQALNYYNQALPIHGEVKDRSGEAATLNNIGAVYDAIGQPNQAFNYFNQALPILREIKDRSGEATTLHNIGGAYNAIGWPQQALNYFNQALPIRREVKDRSGEAATLSNIGLAYKNMNRPKEAIATYEQAVKITLEMRSSLQRENRQQFLKAKSGSAVGLIDLLIEQNQADHAFEWVNIATTYDLADYTRLVNAQVKNPDAQKAIDEWNQKNQQLQFLYNQLKEKPSEENSRQMRVVEAEVLKQAEEISQAYPEVAELFETKPTDIEQLRKNIPEGTVVIQPVLLTNVTNVPNTVAIFILTKDILKVIKNPINPDEFNQLVKDYHEQLEGQNTDYQTTSRKLYDILIRPIEAEIQALSPTQLAIITTGSLRHIPFETLYDSQTKQYLIQKYPVHYLTRISSRSLSFTEQNFVLAIEDFLSLQNLIALTIAGTLSLVAFRKLPPLSAGISVILIAGTAVSLLLVAHNRTGTILGLGNPPSPKNLAAAEAEVQGIGNLLAGSEIYLGNRATLDTFKTKAPSFPFLHLATHGCFQLAGCPDLKMDANTLLFADKPLNIGDAALLGLQNTELLTLSACQTALQTESDGREIAGVAYLFERAGAKAVMASLWSVEDTSTKDLMIKFYSNLKQGMSKGEALRQAKISQINKHPFFWSPFILIGDAQ